MLQGDQLKRANSAKVNRKATLLKDGVEHAPKVTTSLPCRPINGSIERSGDDVEIRAVVLLEALEAVVVAPIPDQSPLRC